MTNNELLNEAGAIYNAINENVPPAVKANFFNALGRLGSSIIDIQLAKYEGKAQEIRATNAARNKIPAAITDKMIEKLEVNRLYADFAVEKYTNKILREQVNIDAVTTIAANELNNMNYEHLEVKGEVSHEWLDEYESICRKKSSDDMRSIFGMILAKEVTAPGSFSLKSMQVISQLEKNVAEHFLLFSQICVHVQDKNRIVAVFAPEYTTGPLQPANFSAFNISPSVVVLLKEFGLLSSSNDYSIAYSPKSEKSDYGISTFWTSNGSYSIDKTNKDAKDKLYMNGILLSTAGKDLFSIIDVTTNDEVVNKLRSFFENNQYALLKN